MKRLAVFGQEDDEGEKRDLAAKAAAAYKPQALSSSASNASSSSTTTSKPSLSFLKQEPEPTPYVKDTKAKRRQNMDAFFEELKRYGMIRRRLEEQVSSQDCCLFHHITWTTVN